MRISKFNIENFRNIKRADVNFGALNILTGRNSSGKSNMLMAISHALNTEQDYSIDFLDNVVTYGQGLHKTTFTTTLSDINTKTIFYNGNSHSYYAPTAFKFKNVIAKKTNSSIQQELYYSGELSEIDVTGKKLDNSRDFIHEIEDFKRPPAQYRIANDELVLEKNFKEEIETTEDKQVIKKLEEKTFDNQSNFETLFLSYKNSIFSWVRSKEFSSSAIYKYVTIGYDSEIYELVVNRIKKPVDIRSGRSSDFSKASFIMLLADIQKSEKQFESFTKDLKLYTDGIVNKVMINLDGSLGTKGEIWIDSTNSPKDITSASAGTAVMLYFITLKNWLNLGYEYQSFQQPYVMLFDEVDSIIHPSLIGSFNEVLNQISKSVQLFISTHSPHFIDCFEKNQLYWLRDVTCDSDTKGVQSSIYSYDDILSKVPKDNSFFKNASNSQLFIEGLLDSIFPVINGK